MEKQYFNTIQPTSNGAARRPKVGRRVRNVFYPDSDGLPMAQNPKQFELIVKIQANLRALYADDANVWIGQDQFWYPVKGLPDINVAPDVFLVFGRPKKYRPHYQQWLENNVSPQVVFEILSPSNKPAELRKKLLFYEKYGVEEYYVLDADFRLYNSGLAVYLREKSGLVARSVLADTFVSPRMQIRVTALKKEKDFEFFFPDGTRFITEPELRKAKKEAEEEARRERKARVEAEFLAELAERQAEEARLGEEAFERQAKEAERQAEEARLGEEAFEREAKEAERIAEEARLGEEAFERQAKEAERQAEEARLGEEAFERQAKEAERQAEEARLEKDAALQKLAALENYLRSLRNFPENLP